MAKEDATGEQWNGKLLDGEALGNRRPDTFEMPSRRARMDIRPGQYVKLGFLLDKKLASGLEGERMWVRVISSSHGRRGEEGRCVGYFGKLENVPAFIDMSKYASDAGYSVAFGPEHVLDIREASS